MVPGVMDPDELRARTALPQSWGRMEVLVTHQHPSKKVCGDLSRHLMVLPCVVVTTNEKVQQPQPAKGPHTTQESVFGALRTGERMAESEGDLQWGGRKQ